MKSMGMIVAENLTKRYEDGLLALDAINFSVARGEIYCLVGASGSGKTTALNLFLDFIKPTSGRALINNIEVAQSPLNAKKYLSFGSADIKLYDKLTACQNLDFFARLGGRRELTKEDCYTVLREVGLPEVSFEQKLKLFSKSMQQKVGLAIVILRDTPAILLDDPTAGLDPQANAELLETLDRLRRQQKAVLVTTYDIFRVWEIADRVGVLREGRKILELTREELLQGDMQALYLDYTRGSYRVKGDNNAG